MSKPRSGSVLQTCNTVRTATLPLDHFHLRRSSSMYMGKPSLHHCALSALSGSRMSSMVGQYSVTSDTRAMRASWMSSMAQICTRFKPEANGLRRVHLGQPVSGSQSFRGTDSENSALRTRSSSMMSNETAPPGTCNRRSLPSVCASFGDLVLLMRFRDASQADSAHTNFWTDGQPAPRQWMSTPDEVVSFSVSGAVR